ncbi:MAG TPA: ATP-binding cassette domain-containing protein [Frankiaceae bacterium]|jgi:ABC-2 type transport system ATP-binding protein|nr:ATP-binding cassette domain-containing protein [Frankiaceae bacterium]
MTPPIKVNGLRKVFSSAGREIRAVDGIDLEVTKGEFFGLLGPNGAGKSTTIGMLTTRVIPTEGEAFIAGVDVVADPATAKRYIGVVTQTNTLDRQLSVAENLEFHGRYFGMTRRDAATRSEALLDQFKLADRRDANVAELSGGMAQRLMVARALVHEPEILFLDEPTSGIDPQTRLALWEILRDLHAAGQTILLTTHYMEEADALCERLAIIDHGKVLALGTPEELKSGLGADTVITLTFAEPPDALLPKVERLAAIDHVERSGDTTLRVYAADAEGLLADIVILATKAKARVVGASSQPPTLEAVFLALTGRDLRE